MRTRQIASIDLTDGFWPVILAAHRHLWRRAASFRLTRGDDSANHAPSRPQYVQGSILAAGMIFGFLWGVALLAAVLLIAIARDGYFFPMFTLGGIGLRLLYVAGGEFIALVRPGG
jgi:hypothetical protein